MSKAGRREKRSKSTKASRRESVRRDASKSSSRSLEHMGDSPQGVWLDADPLHSPLRRSLADRIARTQGNRYLQDLVRSARGKERRQSPTSVLQRVAQVPGLPANRVQQAEVNLSSDPQAAVDAVLQGLVDRGQVDLSYLAGRRITYVADRSRMPSGHYGHTSLTPGTGRPRPCRVIVGPDAMRSVGLLYTTIMHEYQHVLQFRTASSGVAEAVDEFEARLWEVEHLRESGLWRDIQYMALLPGQLGHWWNELTPSQKAPRIARYRRAQATIRAMNRRRLEEQRIRQTGAARQTP